MSRIAPFIALLIAVSGCSFEPSTFEAVDGSDAASDATYDTDPGLDGDTNTGDGGVLDMSMPEDMANTDMATNDMDAADMAVDAGPTMCDGQIVDLQTSNAHCGECDNACDPDYGQCRRGVCVCVDPYDPCGDDNFCTDKTADPSNCGVCGFACDTGQFCDNGTCTCLPGLTVCGGECVDTNTNPSHCSDCNIDCGTGSCKDGSCRQSDECGVFVYECRTDSGGTACLTDTSSPLSCEVSVLDECGEVCEGTQICNRPALVEPNRCRDYRPARGCVNCPCDDCSDSGETCTELDLYDGQPFCVN